MATRNERKRKAKERALAIVEALKPKSKPKQEVTIWKPRQDMFDVAGLIQGHQEPRERRGLIVNGKLVSSPMKEPAKRDLVFHPTQGRYIEIAKRYYGGKR